MVSKVQIGPAGVVDVNTLLRHKKHLANILCEKNRLNFAQGVPIMESAYV